MINNEERESLTTRIVLLVMSFCNVYSLVVVFGSISTAFFFSYYWDVSHDVLFYWLLGSSVWLIYTFDHLLDAHRLGQRAASLRHRLHFKFRNPLLVLVFFILGFNVTVAFLNRETNPYILYGLLLFGCFCLYLFSVMIYHKRDRPVYFKELFVAIFATLGIAVSPIFGKSVELDTGSFLLLSNFTLLNFVNLLTFSRFDLRNDRIDKMLSLASLLGFAKTSRWVFNLLALVFLITIVWLFTEDWNHKIKGALSFLLMVNFLSLVNLRYNHFSQNGLYRFWGDFIYLIPGLVVLLKI